MSLRKAIIGFCWFLLMLFVLSISFWYFVPKRVGP